MTSYNSAFFITATIESAKIFIILPALCKKQIILIGQSFSFHKHYSNQKRPFGFGIFHRIMTIAIKKRASLNREIRFMTSWCNSLPDSLNEKYKNIRQTLPQQFFYFHHTYLPFSWYFLTLQLRPNNLRIFESVDKLSLTQR